MIICDEPSNTTHRTLIDGRIPQVWDLPLMRRWLQDAERLTCAPDPRDAQYFRERAETLARAIQETEHDR
jgi:hypothetical protein